MPRKIKYVDFGIPDARTFFNLVVLPNVQQFEAAPSVQTALNAAWALWHMCEWYWHDLHPDERLADFRQRVCGICPELQQLRDITDAAKHREVSRDSHAVKNVSTVTGRGGAGGWNTPGGGYGVTAHPTFADAVWRARACAPQLRHGEVLGALQYRLAIRAARRGDMRRERRQTR